jgi:hypothetical protein
MRYERIVFAQGEDATEPLEILDRDGEEAAMDYLAQWYMGDGGDIHDQPGAGTSDTVYEEEETGLRLIYNTRLGYIGLERILQ